MLVLLAIRAADPLDRLQLGLGGGLVALRDVGLAEVLANLRVTGRERYGFQVIADPLVEPGARVCRIAPVIERLRRTRVAQEVEGGERLVVALRLGQRIGV